MSITVDLEIFTPRWGHDDTYSVDLHRDHMEIRMQVRTARATWRDNLDPLWSGEPLQRIMENDMIYPPEVIQSMFEHVWKEWRNGELNDQQAASELQEIATWLNIITKAKPGTEFWRRFF